MNLSHVIHEFSFGPFFPAIAQPLDMTYVKTEESECRVRGRDHRPGELIIIPYTC